MSKSSSRWLRRQAADPYVRDAQKQGYRSRAVYKLAEIIERDRLLRTGMRVVDLGAAPGGWSQWLIGQCQAQIVAVDILSMAELPGVTFIEGDFTEESVLQAVGAALGGHKAALVLSDLAPNISGIRDVDQPRSMYLAELARDFALEWLEPGGSFVTKLFQGEGVDNYIKELRPHFRQVSIRKPRASRSESREVYVLAKGYL
jgi:23S rRNA (uridine2552-2'-O)-methyltransferase